MGYTEKQQNVIDFRGKNILVSASAGTGKTTVMIERIAKLIDEQCDISSMVVVTFTNLAAAEMKNRLANKLMNSNRANAAAQLEKLDGAAISTLHSFCADLVRNYFYVVDVDPSFSILDDVTAQTLKANALEEVFRDYFDAQDSAFLQLYKILSTSRKEENFRETLFKLYEFSRCLVDFDNWYKQTRAKMFEKDSLVEQILLKDISANAANFQQQMQHFADYSKDIGSQQFADVCTVNAQMLQKVQSASLEEALNLAATTTLFSLGSDKGVEKQLADQLRKEFKNCRDDAHKFLASYANLAGTKNLQQLWQEVESSALLTDKLAEIVQRFDEVFFLAKKQRGALDFNDLEHLALQVLQDNDALESLRSRYKMIFVDEYQDTNPVQEAIVSTLAQHCNLFMVGDIKQSIYAFRGCDPSIFLEKYRNYKAGEGDENFRNNHRVEELNVNFRSNHEILEFVNDIFDQVMTESFGKVDYLNTARLEGFTPPSLKTPSVKVDLVVKKAEEKQSVKQMYDITAPQQDAERVTQGQVVAANVLSYVGMAYKDKEGNARRIGYGDIVVLLRSMGEGATEIYNALMQHNIPVSASFKTESYANKEVRDIINLLRAVDNPYNDIYLVGACLSPIGGFSQDQLAQIKIATDKARLPFFERMKACAETDSKIQKFVQLLEELRFFSHSATVDEVVLRLLEKSQFHLYVQGFPNGALRLGKLYDFIENLKGASFAQSISKFLYFLDQSTQETEQPSSDTNAVRLMTMHASKGLEFPVVIVADVNHGFKFDDNGGTKVFRNTAFGLAMRHYDFVNMKTKDTLATFACNLFNKTKLREEEMRLLYVALTRAKFVLNIVGVASQTKLQRWCVPEEANCHLDWILSAIKNKYGQLPKELVNIVEKQPQALTATGDLMCQQLEDDQQVLQLLQYRYPYADQTNMPGKLVSSALDREFIDEEEQEGSEVIFQNDDKHAIGTAYHKVYQYVDYNADKQGIAAVVEGLVNQGKVEQHIAQQLDLDLVWRTLNNSQLRQLASSGKAYREMPFMLLAPYNQVAKDGRFSDDVVLQGVIDLLVVRQHSAAVVDFKFSTHSEEILRKDYRYQLASYRLAVQKICGIEQVESFVFSIPENKLIKI